MFRVFFYTFLKIIWCFITFLVVLWEIDEKPWHYELRKSVKNGA